MSNQNNLTEEEKNIQEYMDEREEIVDVNGNDDDTYKQSVNVELKESKKRAISELKTFTYKTPPIKISPLLRTLFADCDSNDGWWLYVAQHWNPRAINRVINQMVKVHKSGAITIRNPAKYFTYLIKFRKKRKEFRTTNDTR